MKRSLSAFAVGVVAMATVLLGACSGAQEPAATVNGTTISFDAVELEVGAFVESGNLSGSDTSVSNWAPVLTEIIRFAVFEDFLAEFSVGADDAAIQEALETIEGQVPGIDPDALIAVAERQALGAALEAALTSESEAQSALLDRFSAELVCGTVVEGAPGDVAFARGLVVEGEDPNDVAAQSGTINVSGGCTVEGDPTLNPSIREPLEELAVGEVSELIEVPSELEGQGDRALVVIREEPSPENALPAALNLLLATADVEVSPRIGGWGAQQDGTFAVIPNEVPTVAAEPPLDTVFPDLPSGFELLPPGAEPPTPAP